MRTRFPRTLATLTATAALALTALASLPARAEGIYLGASLGVPRYNDGIAGISGNGSGVSGKVFGGYQFTPNFALEAGLADLGHINGNGGTLNGHSQYIDAVGLLPLNSQWSLLGSAGLAHVKLDTSNGNDGGNGLKLGLGAEYTLSKNVALRGEWEHYQPAVFGPHRNILQIGVD